VLDEQDRHALDAQLPEQLGERLLFRIAQSCRRLVQQQQHRIARERARDLDHALTPERQAAGGLVQLPGKSHPLDLARRLGQQLRFLGALQPQHCRDRALAPAQCAPARRLHTDMPPIRFTC
jgi:hypothetical protein